MPAAPVHKQPAQASSRSNPSHIRPHQHSSIRTILARGASLAVLARGASLASSACTQATSSSPEQKQPQSYPATPAQRHPYHPCPLGQPCPSHHVCRPCPACQQRPACQQHLQIGKEAVAPSRSKQKDTRAQEHTVPARGTRRSVRPVPACIPTGKKKGSKAAFKDRRAIAPRMVRIWFVYAARMATLSVTRIGCDGGLWVSQSAPSFPSLPAGPGRPSAPGVPTALLLVAAPNKTSHAPCPPLGLTKWRGVRYHWETVLGRSGHWICRRGFWPHPLTQIPLWSTGLGSRTPHWG